MPLNKDYLNKKFDIDLNFGVDSEKKICEILEGGNKIEVKTERDIWKKTGNIVIEYKNGNNPSGISITEADYWIHNLTWKGEMVYCFIFPVNKLKKVIKQMINKGIATKTSGGDYLKSKLILLPIKSLVNEFR